jgi:hypothetical protein
MYLNITSCHVSVRKQINSCGYISLKKLNHLNSKYSFGFDMFLFINIFFHLELLLSGLQHMTCSSIFLKGQKNVNLNNNRSLYSLLN